MNRNVWGIRQSLSSRAVRTLCFPGSGSSLPKRGPRSPASNIVAQLRTGKEEEKLKAKQAKEEAAAAVPPGVPPPPPQREFAEAFPQEPDQGSRADQFKELIRPYRRYVYTWQDWVRHRSDQRFFRYLEMINVSEVFRGLLMPASFFVFNATVYCALATALQKGILFWAPIARIDLAAFSLSIPVLSLLLVFRTNSAFQRWDDARKMWGMVVNRARDLGRMATTMIRDSILQEAFIRWLKAYTWALKCHVRPGEAPDLKKRLGSILQEEELAGLEATRHKPNYCLHMMARTILWSGMTGSSAHMFSENMTALHDVTGGCERILRTPIYVPYTRNTTRFLILFLFFLPAALFWTMGWLCVPAIAFMCFLMLGVEEIGIQIEEPFSVLPLESISSTICSNLDEMIENYPKPDTAAFEWEAPYLAAAAQQAAARAEGASTSSRAPQASQRPAAEPGSGASTSAPAGAFAMNGNGAASHVNGSVVGFGMAGAYGSASAMVAISGGLPPGGGGGGGDGDGGGDGSDREGPLDSSFGVN